MTKSPGFELDKCVDVVDPDANEVIDKADQKGVIRIKDGQRIVHSYVWQHDNSQRANNQELISDEIHGGDFSGGEDNPNQRSKFKHVTKKLDYLFDLGIKVIELILINEFLKNHH